MKRNYLFYWFAVLLLLFTSARSYAEVYSGTCGESVNWSLDTETGLLEITGSGEIAGYSDSDAPWYKYKSNIKECVIENGVTSIGNSAFSVCTGLTSITIPESVTSIGDYALRGCTGLTSITIPNSVTSIGYYALRGCTGLTSITIPNSVTSIKGFAFYKCTNLMTVFNFSNLYITKGSLDNGYVAYYAEKVIEADTQIDDFFFDGNYLVYYIGNETELTLPEKYQGGSYNVGESVFSNYSKLTTIIIPESVKSIGNFAFSGCSGLTSINVDKNNPNYCSQNGVLFTKDMKSINCVPAGKTGDYSIPNSVTSIGRSAFEGCTGLTNITIPESVTNIGSEAFSGCTGLTSITIPESVTSIGYKAFYNCTGLTSVTIGNSVTSIGDDAFYGTPWLNNQSDGLIYIGKICYSYKGEMPENTTIIIKEGTTSIEGSAFYNCTGLTSITIPNSVTSIGNSAFSGCTGLTSINIPNSVTSIEGFAFSGCTGLTSITIPNSVTSIGNWAFEDCTGLTSITIPESVTSIGMYAFRNCTGLTSITIPNSVTSIGNSAFVGCTGLTSITIPNSVTSIGNWAFEDCTGLTSITIPESVTSIEYYAFSGCTNLKTVLNFSNLNITKGSSNNGYVAYYADKVIKADTQIDDFFFEDRTDGKYLVYYIGNETELTLPEKYQGGSYNVGESVFSNYSKLTNIIIPESVTSIGNYAFSGCSGLTNITIPESVTSIGYYAFKGCTGLTSITIPESVTSIGYEAFYGCTGLTSITIPESVTSIGTYAFSGCTGLTSITIPNSVTSIGNSAFKGCTGLTKITIPESVTNIGSEAFSGCTGLTSITIPESVTSIGYKAFYNCTGLTSVTIGNSVTIIGDDAFYNCTGLTSITIPNSVTNIGNSAFEDCTNLKTVFNFSNLNITKGSSSYGYVAYYADKVIKADTQIDDFFFEDRTDGNYLIYYIGNETELTLPENYQGGGYNVGESVFSNYSKLTNITIPESVTSIGNSAFSGCSGLTSITIPNSVTSIGVGAFLGCTGLTNITIPENVTSIGIDAFCGCNNLTSIVWNVKSYPDPTSYEESPFYSNIGTVQEFIFGEGITSIPKYLCKGMTNLKTLTFPQSLTSIRHYAFEGCTNLRIITIPENVKGIGHNAFSGCTKMRQIYCRSQEPPVCGNLALDGIDTWDCTLFVPEGAEALYKAADQWKEFFFIEEITGIDAPKVDKSGNATFDIYDMSGRMVRKGATTTDGLKVGLYIINGRKVLVE